VTGAGARTGDGHVVSVVIPTLGRQTIEGTRRALQGQTRPPDEVVEVLDVERRGSSWARNEGFRQSRGDLVALTDDDAVPPPDWIERLVGAIDRHDAAAAGGRFLETDDLLRRKSERNVSGIGIGGHEVGRSREHRDPPRVARRASRMGVC
jgi:glycosyltransferase involved in cell wall biosynthesis